MSLFLFHTVCLGVVLVIMIFFVIDVIKNNFPKDSLFWLILLQGILISVHQILCMIKYSIGG